MIEREHCEKLDFSEEVRTSRMERAPDGYVCVKEISGMSGLIHKYDHYVYLL